MTRDDLAPLGESEPFPCENCYGSGRVSIQGLPVWTNCSFCGGSGYGPPPPALDRERCHALERLSKWAHRAHLTEEF